MPPLVHDGIDGADAPRQRVHVVEQGDNRLFVGYGDVGAQVIRVAKLPQLLCQVFGRHLPEHVLRLHPQMIEGGLMKSGRHGVPNRISEEAHGYGHRPPWYSATLRSCSSLVAAKAWLPSPLATKYRYSVFAGSSTARMEASPGLAIGPGGSPWFR